MVESFDQGKVETPSPDRLKRLIDDLNVQLESTSDTEKIGILERMLALQMQLNESLNEKAEEILVDEGQTPGGVSFKDRIGALYQQAKDKSMLLFVGSGIISSGALFVEGHLRSQAEDFMAKFDVSKATELLGQADFAHLAMSTGLTVGLVSALLIFLKRVEK